MGKFFQQYQKPIAVAALVLIGSLLAAAKYNVFPFQAKPGISQAPVNNAAIVQASTANMPAGIVRTGTVESSIVVPINSEYTGRVSEMLVKEGQAVKAGQPLFKLEPSSVGNDSAGTAVPRQDSYTTALNEYNRLQKLYELGAIPRRQLENAAARLQEAKDSSNNPSTSGVLLVLRGPATIKAPVDGIVTSLAASSGNTVQAGQQVMALGSGQTLEIVVPLEQNDLYLVHLGTPVAVEAAGQTVMGQVSSIFPEVQENKVSIFQAHIKLANAPADLLKAGMSVKVRIDTGK